MAKRTKDLIKEYMRGHSHKRQVLIALASIVVFVTSYALILPALTLNKEDAASQGGISVQTTEQEAEAAEETNANPVDNEDKAEMENQDKDSAEENSKEGKSEQITEAEQENALNETIEEKETEGEQTSGESLVYEDKKIKVTATPHDTEIPGGAVLEVTEITSDMKAYEAYFKALNRGFRDNPYNSDNSLLYDVSIMVDGAEYEPESGEIEIQLDFKKNQLSTMLDEKLSENSSLRVIHLPVKDTNQTDDVNNVKASQIEKDYVSEITVDTEDTKGTETVSFALESLSVITVTGASTDVTINGSLSGTDMQSLGYNLYFFLVSQTSDNAYSAKINFANQTYQGTISSVPVGKYDLYLAYDKNNSEIQINMPKSSFTGNSNIIKIKENGQYVFGYAAKLPQDTTIDNTNKELSFELAVPSITNSAIDAATIMDRAINYGIVADEVVFKNNCNTNFATKKLTTANQNGGKEVGTYNNRAEGEPVPNLVADITLSDEQKLKSHDKDSVYYVPDSESSEVEDNDKNTANIRNKDEIEDRVEIMLSNTFKYADTLKNQSMVVLPSNLTSVDVSCYPATATIILDATTLSGIQNGFTVTKRPGQTIVFNIGGKNAAPPENINVKLVDDNGNQIDINGNPTTQNYEVKDDPLRKADAKVGNVWNKLIWNFYEAEKVATKNTIGGVFLVPHGDFELGDKGCGWIMARGKVIDQKNEWYAFPGTDKPFEQKTIRKIFVGLDLNEINPNYELKLYTHTNDSTSGTTNDRLVTTFVLDEYAGENRETSNKIGSTGGLKRDAVGNYYCEWVTPSLAIGNEHKIKEENSKSTTGKDVSLIEFEGPFSGWSEDSQNYEWTLRYSEYDSQNAFNADNSQAVFNVRSSRSDRPEYDFVTVTNNYNIVEEPHNLSITKKVIDKENLEEEDQVYSFKIALKDTNEVALSDRTISYKVDDGDEVQHAQLSSGVVKITLKRDQKATLLDLPYGTSYVITEESLPQYCEVLFSGDTSSSNKADGRRLIKDRSVIATNTYSRDPGIPITAHKDLIGGVLSDGQFTFRLIDSAGKLVQSATNDASGNVLFDTLVFDTDGEYEYKLYEVADLRVDDIIYDPAVYSVHLEVQGGRVRDVTYNGTKTTPMFRNTKIDLHSNELKARKVFVDADEKAINLTGGEFTFTADGNNGKKYTGTNDSNGMVTFIDEGGNHVDLNELSETTSFVIKETGNSYTGDIPSGQTLTYDTKEYNATAEVSTKTVEVVPWSQVTEDSSNNTTLLTITFTPSDTTASKYYVGGFFGAVYSELRSDNTVTFTIRLDKYNFTMDGKPYEKEFEYGSGDNYYYGGGHKKLGDIIIEATSGGWGGDPVTVSSVKIDGKKLESITREEKTITLKYENGTYPVFKNKLTKPEADTVDFQFSKIWRDAFGENNTSWPAGKSITINVFQGRGTTDRNPAVYATYIINKADADTINKEIFATGQDSSLPKLKVIANSNNTYSFKLEGLPAKGEEGGSAADYVYYVSEPDKVDGYQSPKYYVGTTQQKGATYVGDEGIIANDESIYELPHTGGMGTTIYYILGAMLTIASIAAILLRKRIAK